MTKEINITREMLNQGYNQGLVNIVEKDSCIVCEIGEYWFYFTGNELENYSLEEFLNVTEKDDNLDNIYSILENFHTDFTFQDEYEYYYWYLMKNLK